KFISVARIQPGAEGPRIHRERRMQVGVAEERTDRKTASRVRGVKWLRGKHFLGGRLIEGADIGVLGETQNGKKIQGKRRRNGESFRRNCFQFLPLCFG